MPIRVNLDPSGTSQYFKYIEDGRTPDRPENYTDYTIANAPPEVMALLNQDTVAQQSPSATWRGQGPPAPLNTGNNGYPTLGGSPAPSATQGGAGGYSGSPQQQAAAAPSVFAGNPLPPMPTSGYQAPGSPAAFQTLPGGPMSRPGATGFQTLPGGDMSRPVASFDQLMAGRNPGPPAMLTPSQGGYPDPTAAQYSPRQVQQANQGVQAQFDQFRAGGISPIPVANGPMSANANLVPGNWQLSIPQTPANGMSVPGVNDLVAPAPAAAAQAPAQPGQFQDPNLNAIMAWMGQNAQPQQPSAFSKTAAPAVGSGYHAPAQPIPTVVPSFNSNPNFYWDPFLQTWMPTPK